MEFRKFSVLFSRLFDFMMSHVRGFYERFFRFLFLFPCVGIYIVDIRQSVECLTEKSTLLGEKNVGNTVFFILFYGQVS